MSFPLSYKLIITLLSVGSADRERERVNLASTDICHRRGQNFICQWFISAVGFFVIISVMFVCGINTANAAAPTVYYNFEQLGASIITDQAGSNNLILAA